jgi:cell wall-associated NlpC family hydrolase
MTLTAPSIVQRARSLVGAPFRPQGRDPQSGLDCVGVVLRSFLIPAACVRRDYRLRGPYFGEVEAALSTWFERKNPTESRAGDVILFALPRDVTHLAVHCGETFVHADASLCRVVETPITDRWPMAGTFRSRSLAQPD